MGYEFCKSCYPEAMKLWIIICFVFVSMFVIGFIFGRVI